MAKFAERTAEKLGFQPGDDIHELVEKTLGGTIEIEAWDERAPSGMIDVRGPKQFTISLSPYTSRARDVFTIAHELGHYFLHAEGGKKRISVRREGNNRAELEANWFAANFLLPKQKFTDLWREHKGNHYLIANQLRVSPAFVAVRASRLNLA